MFKSRIADTIFFGLGVSCYWALPVFFASVTGTGFLGGAGFLVFMLIATAAIAEYIARRHGKAT